MVVEVLLDLWFLPWVNRKGMLLLIQIGRQAYEGGLGAEMKFLVVSREIGSMAKLNA